MQGKIVQCTHNCTRFFPLYTGKSVHVLATASFPYTYTVQRKSVYVLATSSFPYIHLLTTAYFPYKHEKMLHVLVTASFPYVQETVYTYWQQLRSLIHRENNQNKYVLATSYFPCIHALTTAFFPYVHEQIVHILAKASFLKMGKNCIYVGNNFFPLRYWGKVCTYWQQLISVI